MKNMSTQHLASTSKDSQPSLGHPARSWLWTQGYPILTSWPHLMVVKPFIYQSGQAGRSWPKYLHVLACLPQFGSKINLLRKILIPYDFYPQLIFEFPVFLHKKRFMGLNINQTCQNRHIRSFFAAFFTVYFSFQTGILWIIHNHPSDDLWHCKNCIFNCFWTLSSSQFDGLFCYKFCKMILCWYFFHSSASSGQINGIAYRNVNLAGVFL